MGLAASGAESLGAGVVVRLGLVCVCLAGVHAQAETHAAFAAGAQV